MKLNYAIFRSQPIYTLNDLAQIGSHNKREKKAYKSNPDIELELTKDNVELIPLEDKYVKGFYDLTKEYRKQHEKKQKTEREDRKKTFNQMVNGSKNVVADELMFTATHTFFKNMSKEDIKKWADTCMEFVYNDLGYKKEQILHAIIHMDEKSPHVHCVVVPLVKKLDKRTNTERYTISKKQYIKDKIHLSELQDLYHKRLTDKGYDLERGIKGSDTEHLKIKDYKRITQRLNKEITIKNERLNNAIETFEDNMKTNKEVLFDKEYVKIKKDTFDSMNQVIIETKNIVEMQPKLQNALNQVESYTRSYKSIEKENQNIQKELKSLKTRNHNLIEENKNLKNTIKFIFEKLKEFFRKLLLFGNENVKDDTTKEVKYHFLNDNFDTNDVIDIAENTTKEDELFGFVGYELEEEFDDYNVEESKDFEI